LSVKVNRLKTLEEVMFHVEFEGRKRPMFQINAFRQEFPLIQSNVLFWSSSLWADVH
jgi:hypothetical protein